MTKISINLLPGDFREEAIKNAKFSKIQLIGISTILFLFFLSSITVMLKILQSKNLANINNNLIKTEEKINSLQDTQKSLFLLKDRLTIIDKYFNVPSSQTQIYSVINKLLPSSVTLTSSSVDKTGEVLVSVISPDADSVDEFIKNLSAKESNENKISRISLESINLGKDGLYRVNLKIKPNI